MRRKVIIVLLSLGTIGGYACGIASCAFHCHARHEKFEQHLAQVCVDAARNAPITK
jgi:hypothetical protein